jgi:hypothetical protein
MRPTHATTNHRRRAARARMRDARLDWQQRVLAMTRATNQVAAARKRFDDPIAWFLEQWTLADDALERWASAALELREASLPGSDPHDGSA